MTNPPSRKRATGHPSTKPPAGDVPAITAFLRTAGSVAFYVGDVPEDFLGWRRAIRRAAKSLDMRVSVRRQGNTVWVLDPDYEPTAEVLRATVEAVGSILDDEPVDFATALHRQRRQRLTAVQSESGS